MGANGGQQESTGANERQQELGIADDGYGGGGVPGLPQG